MSRRRNAVAASKTRRWVVPLANINVREYRPAAPELVRLRKLLDDGVCVAPTLVSTRALYLEFKASGRLHDIVLDAILRQIRSVLGLNVNRIQMRLAFWQDGSHPFPLEAIVFHNSETNLRSGLE